VSTFTRKQNRTKNRNTNKNEEFRHGGETLNLLGWQNEKRRNKKIGNSIKLAICHFSWRRGPNLLDCTIEPKISTQVRMRNCDTSFVDKWPAFIAFSLQDRIKQLELLFQLETIGMQHFGTGFIQKWHAGRNFKK